MHILKGILAVRSAPVLSLALSGFSILEIVLEMDAGGFVIGVSVLKLELATAFPITAIGDWGIVGESHWM
jgi:hypothetical protein